MGDQIRPCPFCGGPGIISKSAGRAPYYGVCCDGDCLTFFDCRAETEAYAIEQWNKRPTPHMAVPPPEGIDPIEAAYGCLWRAFSSDARVHHAKATLLEAIGERGKRRGVGWAVKNFPAPTEAEIRSVEI